MPLRFFEDTVAERERIEHAIKKFGCAAEHNYFWYQYYQHYYYPPQRNIFVEGDTGALMTAYDEVDQNYFVVFDPLAGPEHQGPLLAEYIHHIFSTTAAEKIWFQLARSSRPKFLESLSDDYRACRIYYTLFTPVYDLVTFNPELPGGHYKTLRKEMHRFYREHQVAVEDARTYPDSDALRAVVDNWKKNRLHRDRAMTGVYYEMIAARFEGMDEARVFIVDGKPVGFNAGWKIPNSSRFYGGVGIHDYSLEDLGSMLYLEDLVWLKKRGYQEVDMGGTEKSALPFKNKFSPQSFYKMDIFSVARKHIEVPALAVK